MSLIQVQHLHFAYPGQLTPVFEDVNLELDTRWRLGLIGRNGRGKTTFLKLLLGELSGSGRIAAAERFEYFPQWPQDAGQTALAVARGVIAPFDEWEDEMQACLAAGGEVEIARYGELEEQYAAAGGYTIDEMIAADCGRLDIPEGVLERPFATLSGGEKVKLLLAAMFLKRHSFLLIDEPTDHLDAEARRSVARWLAGKSGFILVSHDRAFLDEAIDHVLSINRADIELQRGNYTSWRHNRSLQDEFELAQNEKLGASIKRLEGAAARTERWSDKIEATKNIGRKGQYDGGSPSVDRGYVGHQAARMMQRSKAILQRQGREIEEQKALLKNVEETPALKFQTLKAEKSRLVGGQGLGVCFGSRWVLRGLDFAIERGERVAVCGKNGSGKSTLLALVLGTLQPAEGTLARSGGLVISSLPQETEFLQGGLQDFAAREGLDASLMLAILRKLDFERELFDQPMQRYSAGQKKKVCLAASLAKPAHLFVWDEPLNYIDVLSREQIEAAVLDSGPTLLFVEHDAAFVDKVATRRIEL